jgi:acetyl-CoA carboxylase biotin carboxyl carrier protein
MRRDAKRMDLDELNRILEMVRQHELSEFELESDGFKIKIKKVVLLNEPLPAASRVPAAAQHTNAAAARVAASDTAEADVEAASSNPEIDLAVVKSPIVGTFFRSAEPGSPAFVEVGDVVKKGQVLCIIEAMKLMNEIDSEYDGEVVSVYVENGQPVQYGERLFAIKARSDV